MEDCSDPEDLLPFYERELGLLRKSMRTFSERYPKEAARLGISGERSEDPHVERLLQSAALSNARAAARIDDDYPELPTSMLDRLHPEVLRPFPSCSIAQVRAELAASVGPHTIERGTEFVSHHGKYRFRTVYHVTLAALSIRQARYAPVAVVPRAVVFPDKARGTLSVTFGSPAEQAGFSAIPDVVRVYLDGAPEIVAALLDAFLLRAIAAFVDLDDRGQWQALDALPITAAGFDGADSLFAPTPEGQFPLRLLLEYFAFPERFHFIDIDFSVLRRALKDDGEVGTTVTLHLAIADVDHDSRTAQRLSTVRAENLKLFCSPVVNLFQREVAPAERKMVPGYSEPRYPVVPSDVTQVADTEVWSIDEVWLSHEGTSVREAIEPLQGFGHRKYYGAPVWELRRDGRAAVDNPGYETALVLSKLEGDAVLVDPKGLAIKVTCTNRNLPAGMPVGAPSGDLEAPDTDIKYPVVLLKAPTRSERPKPTHAHWWQLLSHLTPHASRLDQLGLGGLKALFRQFATHTGRPALQIEGMTSLRCRNMMLWTTVAGVGSFERGIEITLSLDEQRFESESVGVLIGVMDRLFAAYVDTNSAIQMVVVSAHTGEIIRKCAPRDGRLAII